VASLITATKFAFASSSRVRDVPSRKWKSRISQNSPSVRFRKRGIRSPFLKAETEAGWE
jgi:hypothetical protein